MRRVSSSWVFAAASLLIASGARAQEPTNSTEEATPSLGVDGRQLQGVGAEGQRPPVQLPSQASTGEERANTAGRSTEPRRANGFTEEERQAMRERRQYMSEEERAAQRRGPQGANAGQFPGRGQTGGVFPGRGETGGVFPGGGSQGGAFPGRGQTGGAFPGGGHRGGAFPGGRRAPGGMPQRGAPRGGRGR